MDTTMTLAWDGTLGMAVSHIRVDICAAKRLQLRDSGCV
jgi:hypothetical protein